MDEQVQHLPLQMIGGHFARSMGVETMHSTNMHAAGVNALFAFLGTAEVVVGLDERVQHLPLQMIGGQFACSMGVEAMKSTTMLAAVLYALFAFPGLG